MNIFSTSCSILFAPVEVTWRLEPSLRRRPTVKYGLKVLWMHLKENHLVLVGHNMHAFTAEAHSKW